MKTEYDHIKEYISADIDEDLRLMISDFALLWNNYESSLFSKMIDGEWEPKYSAFDLKNKIDDIMLDINTDDIEEINVVFDGFEYYCQKRYGAFNWNTLCTHFKFRNELKDDEALVLISKSQNMGDIKSRLLLLLIVIGRIRNNMFHGIKEIKELNKQKDLFLMANAILSKVLSKTKTLRFRSEGKITNRYTQSYLKYEEVPGVIYNELINAVRDMENDKEFDISKFYKYLNELIKEASKSEYFQIIRILPLSRPTYDFGVLFLVLRDIIDDGILEEKCNYLSKFINYKIDVFMIVNFLRNYDNE